jgi:hypothetical protein
MKTLIQETIEAHLADDEEIVLADGFEKAFVGVARQFGKPFAVYDRGLCLATLTEQEMSPEEAEEYMAYNTEGAWVGENTPAFLEFAPTDEEKRIEKFVTALIHLTKTAELLEEKTQLLESFMSALTYFLRRCILRLDELDGPHIPGARDALDAAESFLKTK